MNTLEKIEIVKAEVINHFNQNAKYTGIASPDLFADEQNHIIEIGTSILCTKWEIGYAGGGFVHAFVNNDLMGALGSADGTTIKGFKFFASLVYNVGMPTNLINN
jgi:hypothetical protein